eukprot:1064061-Amphidinium_carterae.1
MELTDMMEVNHHCFTRTWLAVSGLQRTSCHTVHALTVKPQRSSRRASFTKSINSTTRMCSHGVDVQSHTFDQDLVALDISDALLCAYLNGDYANRWQTHITKIPTELGLIQLKSDSSLFRSTSSTLFISCIWMTYSSQDSKINSCLGEISSRFDFKRSSFLVDGPRIQFIGSKLCRRNQSIIEISMLHSFFKSLERVNYWRHGKSSGVDPNAYSSNEIEQCLTTHRTLGDWCKVALSAVLLCSDGCSLSLSCV